MGAGTQRTAALDWSPIVRRTGRLPMFLGCGSEFVRLGRPGGRADAVSAIELTRPGSRDCGLLYRRELASWFAARAPRPLLPPSQGPSLDTAGVGPSNSV